MWLEAHSRRNCFLTQSHLQTWGRYVAQRSFLSLWLSDWYTHKWVCRKHGFSYLFGWFMEEIVRFRLIVEKNRKCNLSTLRGTIRGCMKTWRTFMKTQERPSRDWARRGSKKMKISSPAGNRRAGAHTGGRPWSETRNPNVVRFGSRHRRPPVTTGGRPRLRKQDREIRISFISFILNRF